MRRAGWVLGAMLLLAGGGRCAEPGEASYEWPLSYRGCLTSSFAEYRQNHFHAGIDLSTNGKTGFKVRAVADGEVWRVRTSPYGYGKVLYLSLPGGRLAVYAHLSDFAPHIRELVEQEQERLDRYPVDIRLPLGAVPVSAGEVVGYSGQTGAGAPHLHFEIRDGENLPLNPLRNGFSIRDDAPPIIRSIVLTPLEADSRVNGSVRPLTVDLEWSGRDLCYLSEQRARIEGPVGILVHADDKQDACDYRLGVYSLDLRVNGRAAFRSRFDGFSFDTAHLVGIEYDQGVIEQGGSAYHRLFTTASNLHPFALTDRRHAGVIVDEEWGEYGGGLLLERGLHEVEAMAADANGNVSTGKMTVLVGDPPRFRRVQIVRDTEAVIYMEGSPAAVGELRVGRSLNGGRQWEERKAHYQIDRGAWVAEGFAELPVQRKPLLFRVEASSVEGAWAEPRFLFRNYEELPVPEPVMDLTVEYYSETALILLDLDRAFPYRVEARVLRDQRSALRPEMSRVSPTRFEGVLPLRDLQSETAWLEVTLRGDGDEEWSALQEIRAVRVPALRSGEVLDKEGMAAIRVPRSALVKDTYFRVEKEEEPPLEPGLTYISPVYRFEPADALLRDDVEIALKLFLLSGEGKRAGLYRLDLHGRWNFVSRRVDPEAPEIAVETRRLARYALILDDARPEIFALRPAGGSTVRTRSPRLQAMVSDVGSGFESEDIQIHLDGKKVIAEWDPERNLITYNARTPLSIGSHQMVVYAVDRAGNSIKSEATFYVAGE